MASTHIDVTRKQDDKLIASIIFCKNYAIENYCGGASDERVKYFDYTVRMDSEINENSINSFLEEISYAVTYLEGISKEERSHTFGKYHASSYEKLIEDLKAGKTYLENFKNTRNIN